MGEGVKNLAVRAQRASAADDDDFYPTPPWAGRALCERLREDAPLDVQWCWEPAAGRGDLARAIEPYFGGMFVSDIRPRSHPWRGGGIARLDFLTAPLPEDCADVDTGWVITNPPFNRAEAFFHRACGFGFERVALLVPLRWLEGAQRWMEIYARYPPDLVLVFSERLPMLKGRLLRSATTATAYCWMVWAPELRPHAWSPSRIEWIEPGTRKRLERPGDYDDDPPQLFPPEMEGVR